MNFTFKSLGFCGIPPITVPRVNRGKTKYDILVIEKPYSNIAGFLCHEIIDYSKKRCYESLENHFLCGVAYMLNGTAVLVYNGDGQNANDLYHLILEPNYYKTAQVPRGVTVHNNIEYLSGLINSRTPEAMTIIQEIETNEKFKFIFRIVHADESDLIPDKRTDNIIPFPAL